MARALNTVAVQQFSIDFENEYQQIVRKLAGTVDEVRGIVGNLYEDKTAGEVVLRDRGAFHSELASQIPDYNPVQVTMFDKATLLPSDIFEQAQVNATERMNLARSAAWAIMRQEDQFVINALEASTTTNSIVDGGTNLTLEKLLEAAELLDTQNIPEEMRHFAAHASQKRSLLEETEVTSSDYNTVKALVRGDIDTFLGFKFHWFGNITEGGIPKTGDIRTAFAWHMRSVIMAYGLNPNVSVDWIPERQSWAVIPRIRAGAIERFAVGIVKVACDETA